MCSVHRGLKFLSPYKHTTLAACYSSVSWSWNCRFCMMNFDNQNILISSGILNIFTFQVFFVIRLIAGPAANSLPPIVEPDPLIPCDLMDGRDAFLTLARDKHLEFSSLRRAQWSTMCMLVELHTQSQDRFVYTCNECKHHVETRWHCTVCEVCLVVLVSLVVSLYLCPECFTWPNFSLLTDGKRSVQLILCQFRKKRRGNVFFSKWFYLCAAWCDFCLLLSSCGDLKYNCVCCSSFKVLVPEQLGTVAIAWAVMVGSANFPKEQCILFYSRVGSVALQYFCI